MKKHDTVNSHLSVSLCGRRRLWNRVGQSRTLREISKLQNDEYQYHIRTYYGCLSNYHDKKRPVFVARISAPSTINITFQISALCSRSIPKTFHQYLKCLCKSQIETIRINKRHKTNVLSGFLLSS